MSGIISGRDGYYDDTGHWKRTKFCFAYCGAARCTCRPPAELFYNPAYDKREREANAHTPESPQTESKEQQ